MMKRTLASIIAISAFLVLGSLCLTSRTAAEPISGGPAATPAETTPAQPQQSPELAEAETQFKKGDFAGALKALQAGGKKDPDLPPPQLLMAQMFSQAKMGAEMRSALEQAVIDAPTDPEAYMLMADVALNERRVTEAQMLYQKANELIGEFNKSAKRKEFLQPRILHGLAQVAISRKDWPLAQKHLEAWLKIAPKNTTALQLLAGCLFEQKNVPGALEKLKEAAKLDPEILTPEAMIAQYYEQAGDGENAKKWMVTALTQAPKDLKTRLAAGQWALHTGRFEDAQTQAAAALQLDPTSLGAKILRGVVAIFQKDYTTAERYFELARLQSPRNFAAGNDLALALIEQDDKTKQLRALEYAESNVKLYQRNAEAASTYGWVLYRLGRFDEAEKWLQAAVSSGQVSPDTAYYYARLLKERGRDAPAKQWLEGALKSTAPFAMRQEATALLEKLKK
jgi:tetratricopeptide (TPR) repeat protein